MTRKSFTLLFLTLSASLSLQAASILDIKHSITNENIIAPESFETKTRELEENFYLKNFIDAPSDDATPRFGTDAEYEQLLAKLPTIVEMPYNSIVGKFINLYLGKRRRLVSDMLALHSYYGPIFKNAIEREGLPMELQYLPVIESAINPNAVSRAGAAGLWQFMPSTATGLGLEVNSLVDQRRDPLLSSRQAARYFKQLYDIYEDWSLAIAAYNCGPGRVNQALRRAGGGKKDFWEIYKFLPAETRDYVPAFIAANFVMNYHDRYGIGPTVVKRPLVTDRVEVAERIHFNQIANVLNIPIEEIRMLNPQFRKDIIPGDHHPYMLTLPSQQCLSYIMSEQQIREYDAEAYARRTHVEPGESRYAKNEENPADSVSAEGAEVESAATNIVRKTHIVGRGENIRDIAKKYGVSATDIKHWNKLRRGKVKEGDQLVIEVVERPAAETLASRKTTKTQSTVPMPKERRESRSTDNGRRRYSTGSSATETTDVAPRQRERASRANSDRNRWQTSSSHTSKTKSAAKPKNHTVTKGESLEKIARKNGVTVDELRKANGMKKGDNKILPGQKLKVPVKGHKSAYASTAKSKNNSKATKSKKSTKKASSASKKSKKRR